jgi:uncharacterized RDD family membrane protein YckC
MWNGEDTLSIPYPLKFDKSWASLVIFVEAVPISGPVCSGVDMVTKRKFADTLGKRTMVLKLVSHHGDVSGYVQILQGILLLILPLRFIE